MVVVVALPVNELVQRNEVYELIMIKHHFEGAEET